MKILIIIIILLPVNVWAFGASDVAVIGLAVPAISIAAYGMYNAIVPPSSAEDESDDSSGNDNSNDGDED